MSNVRKNCRKLFILIVNLTICRSVYMKSYKHVPRTFVHIHTLRARAFLLLRWSVLGCGKTRTVLTIGFSGERRGPSIYLPHTFPNFFEDLLHLNTCTKKSSVNWQQCTRRYSWNSKITWQIIMYGQLNGLSAIWCVYAWYRRVN